MNSVPASLWSSWEVRDIECTCDVRRGSAYANSPVQTSGAHKLFLHWPILVRCGDELLFHGPLPGCARVCRSISRSSNAQSDFVSSSWQCFQDKEGGWWNTDLGGRSLR